MHRRHLTAEQKRQAIADHLKLDPTSSDRKIGGKVGVDHKTAAKVRDDLEARGEIPHVSERTDSAGRKQPARKPTRKPKPKPKPAPAVEPQPPETPPESTPEPVAPEPEPETTKLTVAPKPNHEHTTTTVTVSPGSVLSLGHTTPKPTPEPQHTSTVLVVDPDIEDLIADVGNDLDRLTAHIMSLDEFARSRAFDEHLDRVAALARKVNETVQR